MNRYGDGKAGKWPKSQSDGQFKRHFGIVVTAILIGGLILGIAIGATVFATIARHYPRLLTTNFAACWTVLIFVEILLAAIAIGRIRLWDKPLDEIARERIRLLHAGQTEALVAYTLDSLDDQWHLFNGIAMKGGGDIDHVLVGPGGLFCISTKGYLGTYSRREDGVVLRNDERALEVGEAQRLAMKLRHWLEARLDSVKDVKSIPFVRPVLTAPFMHIAFPAKSDNVWIAGERNLRDLVQEQRNALNSKQIQSCVALLKELSKTDAYTPLTK